MKTNQWAMISYITIIGWIVTYVKREEPQLKSTLVNYHLEQSLGLIIFSIVWSIALGIVISVMPLMKTVLSAAGLLPLIFMVFGIINANSGSQRPIPLIGRLFENRFVFLQRN
ncbi:MAG TPA: hypothetical protein VM802_21800 [Chitinophaga sp.]|uniref:DUF4870 domain-containing protein n=1 Tax=Chitinophaga sp. TaxID=1869181 RepID=UPI002B9A7BF7|nr:DUF4870 domain-containing protein [Chitinophaga sp.]HVI47520.1 hypothetical protein [Chitinophaga sp.]